MENNEWNEWNDLIQEDCEDCEEILIDEEKLVMNANAGGMEQIVKNAIEKDSMPVVRF